MRFINRDNELAVLEKEYKRGGSSFVVIYGRRRVGNTTLIKEFIKNKNSCFIHGYAKSALILSSSWSSFDNPANPGSDFLKLVLSNRLAEAIHGCFSTWGFLIRHW